MPGEYSEKNKVVVAWAGISVLFLAAFALAVHGVSAAWDETRRMQDQLDDLAGRLSVKANELERQVARGKSQAEQREFVENLPTLLPEQARFLKSQKILQDDVEGLRRKIGSRLAGTLYILVDLKASKLYLKHGLETILEANCSVGRGGTLIDKSTNRRWDFSTPRGAFRVLWKGEDPVWIKPDWAFVESGKAPPAPDSPERMVHGELGAFLLSIGNGYLIHGTKDEASLGRPVSHGCIRLGAKDLEFVYNTAPVGTRVYVF